MPGSEGAAVEAPAFELERFEWEDGQLELRGRWTGVRGRRFVRPMLTLRDDEGDHRLLADLDHKPWDPSDDDWMAVFTWDGARDGFTEAELSVAPGLEVVLPMPNPARRKPPRKRRQVFKAQETPLAAPPPQPKVRKERGPALDSMQPVDRAADQLAARRAETDALHAQIAQLEAEVLDATARIDAEAAARAEAERERDAAIEERDTARDERDAALAARDVADAERELARRELASATGGIGRETDAIAAERDAAVRERDAIAAERDAVVRERDALEAAAARRAWRDPRRPHPRATVSDWTPRLIAIGIFLAFALVVLLLFHGDL